MAARTWNSGGSTDLNDGANYTGAGALLATDDLTFDNTSVVNAAATAALSVKSVTIAANYTGTWALTGYTLTCADGFSDDGTTGAHNYGNGITCNGASSTFHVGSGVGTITATSCVITMNGTTAIMLDDDKGITAKQLVLGANAVVTRSGAASTGIFQNNGPTLVFTNGGTFTNNQLMSNYYTGDCNFYSILAGAPTIDGTGAIRFRILTDDITCNLPAFNYTGTGTILLSDATTVTTGWTINITGDLTLNVLQSQTSFAGSNGTINLNNTITCTSISYGASNATSTLIINFGAAAIVTGAVNSTAFVAGTTICNMQTSTWSCSGNWTFGSNHTVDRGTSVVTITNTSTVTSNSKCFYWFKVNSGANTVTLADNLCCEKYTLLSGTLNKNGYTLSVGEWNAVVLLGKKKAARRRLLLTA